MNELPSTARPIQADDTRVAGMITRLVGLAGGDGASALDVTSQVAHAAARSLYAVQRILRRLMQNGDVLTNDRLRLIMPD